MNNWRWPWSFIDLRGDGRFPKEWLKGKDKRLVRKRALKKLSDEKAKDYEEN